MRKDKDDDYRAVALLVTLSPEMNRELSKAAERSGRSKSGEARLRLMDHLTFFSEIACSGKRFSHNDK
ncbi:TraY domain-containing protein [Pantoea sp. At-9b]|uniref:TraY domain-containing protein n=1 Tax=Pantoea sp. (strain At-9b) TaxID=592316 RepID=UPI0001B3DEB7|nr:TraY domain-containing protein [Pantoea sp. At-9b]ADU71476.1 TraYfamily protein [Pantoea sp. At-9b]